MAKRPRAARERMICSIWIRDAMAQQLQVDCKVDSRDSLNPKDRTLPLLTQFFP